MRMPRTTKGPFIVAPLVVLVLNAGWAWADGDSGAAGGPKTSSPRSVVGTGGPQNMDSKPTEFSSPPPGAPQTPELSGEQAAKDRQLRDRVQQRWDAIIKGDFPKAYAYETPEYRKGHTAEEYRGQFGGMVRWRMATVKELRYDPPDEAEVVITLDYSFPLPAGDEWAKTTGDFKEQWVLLQDEWWRHTVRQPLRDGKQSEPSRQK